MGTYNKYSNTTYQNTTDKVTNAGGELTLTGIYIGVKKNSELISASESDFELISNFATSFVFVNGPDNPSYKLIKINDIVLNPDTTERTLNFKLKHFKGKELTYTINQSPSSVETWYWRNPENQISNISITADANGSFNSTYSAKYYCATNSTPFNIANYKLSGTIQSNNITDYIEIKKHTIPNGSPNVLAGDYVQILLKSGKTLPTSQTSIINSQNVKLTYMDETGLAKSSLPINITVLKQEVAEQEETNMGYIRLKSGSGFVNTSNKKIYFALEINGDASWTNSSPWRFVKNITICVIRLSSDGSSLGSDTKTLVPLADALDGTSIHTLNLSYTYSGTTPSSIKINKSNSELNGFILLNETLTLTSTTTSSGGSDGGGVGSCCFIAGSQILITKTGKTKNIEDIRNNDKVVSYNRYTQKNYISTVNFVVIKEDVTDVATLTLADGKSVTMNAYHPILTLDGWKSLTNYHGYATLCEGDYVKTIDGYSKLESILREESEEFVTMYNLGVVDNDEIDDIDTDDNFYVNGICAHNTNMPNLIYGRAVLEENFQYSQCGWDDGAVY